MAEPQQLSAQESKDSSCTTFVIRGEDHTLGNALRYVVAKNPKTEFCGYSIHHPSDNKVHLRIQAERQESAEAVLKESLSLLTSICDHMRTTLDGAKPPRGGASDMDTES